MPDAPTQPTARRQETETRIVAAAQALFAEQGVAATKVEAITRRAGVAKGTFFNYFPSKDALTDRLLSGQLAPVLTGLPDDGPLPLRLELLFGLVADLCAAEPETARLTLARTGPTPLTDAVERALTGWLSSGSGTEVAAALPVETAVSLIASVYRTALVAWLGPDGDVPPVPALMATLDQRIAWLFRGIAP